MKKIRISGVEGYYYIEEDTLIYNTQEISVKKLLSIKKNLSINDVEELVNEVEVSDLTELKICQYNELFKQLLVHYPNYEIDKLEGRFI